MTTSALLDEKSPKTVSTPKTAVHTHEYVLRVIDEQGYHPYPKEIRSQMEDFRRISSEIETLNGRPTTNVIRGLSRNEEFVHLPSLISMSPTDRGWKKATDDYWKEFTFKVPVGEKMKLNASYILESYFIEGKDVEVAKPINLEDYIRAAFAMKSSKVAKSEEEANGTIHTCIIEDVSKEQQKLVQSLEENNKADINYVTLLQESNEKKIDWLISKLEKAEDNLSEATKAEKLIYLRNLKTKEAAAFNEEFKNSDLEFEALIFSCVKEGIVIREEKEYFFEDKPLGTIRQAVIYVKTPTNSLFVEKMKKQLQESKSKKLK